VRPPSARCSVLQQLRFSAVIDVPGWTRRRLVATAIATGLGYYFGARLGFAFKPAFGPISALWPPNAILLGALLLTPRRGWFALLIAAFPAHLAVERGAHVPMLMVLCWYVSNCAEAVIGASITRRLTDGPVRLDSFARVNLFLGASALAAPFLSSFLDAGFVRMNGWGTLDYWTLWRLRFSSNVLAILAIVPAIVTWGNGGLAALRSLNKRRTTEASLLAVCLIGLYGAMFVKTGVHIHLGHTLLYAPLPFLLWAAVRFGPAGASAALAGFATLSAWGAVHGADPCGGAGASDCIVSMDLYLIFTFVPVLVLSAVLRERERDAETRRGETALRESSVRLRELADAMPQIVWSARPDGEIDYLNERWRERATRLHPAGSVAWLDAIHPDDRAGYLIAWRSSVRAGSPYEFEARVLSAPTGVFRWHLVRALPVRDAAGQITRWYGTATDIDEQKSVEGALRESQLSLRALGEELEHRVIERTAELSRANRSLREEMQSRVQTQHELNAIERQLAHMGRVAVLGEMGAALAHELNQPLTAILANARALQRIVLKPNASKDEIRSILDDIVADDLRAGAVIRRIRRLVRDDDPETQCVPVNEVVEEVLQLTHNELLLREVSVTTSLARVAPVAADRVQIQQVLLNLVVNACDAMVGMPVEHRALKIETREDGAHVHILVADHGPGIPGDSIFEAFVTTKAQGLGLGLSICRSIVNAHGGRIWATNNERSGATFHVELPRASQHESIPPLRVAARRSSGRRTLAAVPDAVESASTP
jgi:PAS domain S-box-containing protein